MRSAYACRQEAVLWLRPDGGPTNRRWLHLKFTTRKEFVALVEAAVRRDLGGVPVRVDIARLDGSADSHGLVIYEREDIARFGFYRPPRPEQHPVGDPPAATPDEPDEPALFAPPPPPPPNSTQGALT